MCSVRSVGVGTHRHRRPDPHLRGRRTTRRRSHTESPLSTGPTVYYTTVDTHDVSWVFKGSGPPSYLRTGVEEVVTHGTSQFTRECFGPGLVPVRPVGVVSSRFLGRCTGPLVCSEVRGSVCVLVWVLGVESPSRQSLPPTDLQTREWVFCYLTGLLWSDLL